MAITEEYRKKEVKATELANKALRTGRVVYNEKSNSLVYTYNPRLAKQLDKISIEV